MKKILILNGSPRKNGKTASLIEAFIEGAESVGHEVNNMYLNNMNINGCLACEKCSQNGGECVQNDDMGIVIETYEWADVIVLASPQFWGTVSGQLKIVVDRLYAEMHKQEFGTNTNEIAMIMTARGEMYGQALAFYSIFTKIMGWKDHGTVLGAGKEAEARKLGANIK